MGADHPPACRRDRRSYDTPVTLRQLFYRLVSDGTLRNTTSEYTQLGEKTAAARRPPGRSFPSLMDATRSIVQPYYYSSPEEALDELRNNYRRDRTEGQPYLVYVGIEKRGIVEQMRLWFGDDLGIPILPTGGYHSQPFEQAIERHMFNRRNGGLHVPSVLLYAGDLDPESEDIERNFLRWTKFDLAKRVALTPEQADEYQLPEEPGKPASKRAPGFVTKYGRLFQIEVDALPPDVLRALFADAISEFWNEGTYQGVLEIEKSERETL